MGVINSVPDALRLTNGYLVTRQISPTRVTPCRVIDIGVLEDTAILCNTGKVAPTREVSLVAIEGQRAEETVVASLGTVAYVVARRVGIVEVGSQR